MINKQTSKYISLLLRHKPEKENLSMDSKGWVDTYDLISKLNITKEDLNNIILDNNKKRFEYNDDESKIRARQGHSKNVDVELKKSVPPVKLYHGTLEKFKTAILKKGLLKMNRLHVHLSKDLETAQNVGRRKGKDLAILEIDTKAMYADGYQFYLSNNGVWLTEHVPPKYIN